jgi:site-specific DNA-methyltransferase (adenine-specific)
MKQDKTKSFNVDCLKFMATVPDKFYDLAIVDPPYGIGMDGGNVGYKGKNNFEKKNWDNSVPNDFYFNELFRISKNQIIWGGNYFGLPPTRCYLVWDKGEGFYNRTYAECELAWTSFDKNTVKIKHDPLAFGDYKGKIHPTQKPVKIYEWLLMNYAKEGDKILDTHGGSQSSRIACFNLGFELDILELDKDYFDQGNKRFEQHKKQLTLF